MEDSFFIKKLETEVKNETTRRNYINQLQAFLAKVKEHLGDAHPSNLVNHILKHPTKYSQLIVKFYPKDSSRKTMHAMVLSVFKHSDTKCKYDKHYKKWKEFYDKYKELVNNAIGKQEPSPEQKEKFLSFAEMQKGIDSLRKDDPHSSLAASLRFCLINMYMHIRPKRCDFADIKIFHKDPKNENDNYLVLPGKGHAHFVFNRQTKTKIDEPLVETIDDSLRDVFMDSLKKYPRDHLFVGKNGDKFKSPKTFGQFVVRTYVTVYGKKTGVSMQRHIFNTEKIDFQRMSHNYRKEIAKSMGHSMTQQDLYQLENNQQQKK